MTDAPDTPRHPAADVALDRIIAHRGASRAAPENTLAAFRAAIAAGVRTVEFDVSLLGDGTPVLHHDAALDRCTDGRGPLSAIGAADLAGIDAGAWFSPNFAGERIPQLGEALDLLGGAGLTANLEMKPHGADPEPLVQAVLAAMDARPGMAERIVVSSFDAGALAALRARAPAQALAMLYKEPPADWRERLSALGIGALHMRHTALTPEHLAEARAAGIALRVFTVNDPAGLVPLRLPGLDGVITDVPRRFLDDPGWAAWAGR
ncbi:glycerophosphodiester phosphodiesterase family protein [Paralimibaculum aggregatum]|uniref:glycerophosphodiester phosphodiesterase family protein n=1 Tax=Paralimibaculum aggregatum TaxID=3036245 RepID=UPI0025551663|nr:glycerophosphodiester phosphodiesterase family protein [Limibaculum sp. NKW23]